MVGLILDLARQVRGVLRPSAGGVGNAEGWGRGTIVPASNRTGGDLALMTLVRPVTPGGVRVEPTDTDAEPDVLGVVVGYLDVSGLLVVADAPDGSTVAVLKDGVAAVLIDSNVFRGDYAFATTTSGQARGDATLATGAFGQFVAGGGAGQYALVRISMLPGAGSGGGGSIGTPALTLSTSNSAGSGPTVVATDATIAAFDATAPVTQAFGDSAATGSAGKAARRDHKHGMPADPSASFATPAIVLGTAAAAGSAGTVIRSDSTIVAFDATAPTTQAFGDAAAAGSAAVAARRDHKHGIPAETVAIEVACSNETGAVATGAPNVTFRAPFAFTLTAVRASLKTAQTSGSIFTVDVKKNGTTVLSTLITIDNTEKTSTTAATPPVISVSAIADDDELTLLVTQIGDGTAIGLKVVLIGTKP